MELTILAILGCMRYCVSKKKHRGKPPSCSRSKRDPPRPPAWASRLSTVAGSCAGSPTSTTACGLYRRGIRVLVSTAWAASSTTTASNVKACSIFSSLLPPSPKTASMSGSLPAPERVAQTISAACRTFRRAAATDMGGPSRRPFGPFCMPCVRLFRRSSRLSPISRSTNDSNVTLPSTSRSSAEKVGFKPSSCSRSSPNGCRGMETTSAACFALDEGFGILEPDPTRTMRGNLVFPFVSMTPSRRRRRQTSSTAAFDGAQRRTRTLLVAATRRPACLRKRAAFGRQGSTDRDSRAAGRLSRRGASILPSASVDDRSWTHATQKDAQDAEHGVRLSSPGLCHGRDGLKLRLIELARQCLPLCPRDSWRGLKSVKSDASLALTRNLLLFPLAGPQQHLLYAMAQMWQRGQRGRLSAGSYHRPQRRQCVDWRRGRDVAFGVRRLQKRP
eukprot:scaffold803_cov310-Pinguiococcus_pyrenoidosus.AAC.73